MPAGQGTAPGAQTEATDTFEVVKVTLSKVPPTTLVTVAVKLVEASIATVSEIGVILTTQDERTGVGVRVLVGVAASGVGVLVRVAVATPGVGVRVLVGVLVAVGALGVGVRVLVGVAAAAQVKFAWVDPLHPELLQAATHMSKE